MGISKAPVFGLLIFALVHSALAADSFEIAFPE